MTSISLSNDGGLLLSIPSTVEGKSRDVAIPLTIDGLRLIKKTLLARERESRQTIGMDGSPTQEMCNAWLAAKAESDRVATAALDQKTKTDALNAVEEKYGLKISELELDF